MYQFSHHFSTIDIIIGDFDPFYCFCAFLLLINHISLFHVPMCVAYKHKCYTYIYKGCNGPLWGVIKMLHTIRQIEKVKSEDPTSSGSDESSGEGDPIITTKLPGYTYHQYITV